MPAITRELVLEYGDPGADGIRIGGDSDRQIKGYHVQEIERDAGEVTIEFVSSAATLAAWLTEKAALEAAARLIRQRIRLYHDDGTTERDWVDWNPATAANTGFDSEAKLTKPGSDKHDSALSALFRLTLRCGLPADFSGQGGRRDGSFTVSYSPSRRRTTTIRGEYTALAGTTGLGQYEGAIAAHRAAVVTIIGGTHELVGEPQVEVNDSNKVVVFTQVIRELFLAQSGSATDDVDIVDATLRFEESEPSINGSVINGETPSPPVILTAKYHAWIDAGNTKEVRDKWVSTILPWIVEHVTEKAGDGAILAVEATQPTFDFTENEIDATVRFIAYPTNLIAGQITIEDDEDEGIELVAVWDGNRFSKDQHPGPATHRRTITTTTERIVGGVGGASARRRPNAIGGGGLAIQAAGGLAGGLGAIGGVGNRGFGFGAQGLRFRNPARPNAPGQAGRAGGGGGAGGGPNFVFMRKITRKTPRRQGVRNQRQVDVEGIQLIEVFERADPPVKGPGVPAGGNTTVPRGVAGGGVRRAIGGVGPGQGGNPGRSVART